jgi:2'-hydroxyisoflavone reductase
MTMASVLEECKIVSAMVSASDASFTWISEDFLVQEKVAGWSEMPLWIPEEDTPHLKGFMFINCDKAVGAGLTFRPLNGTIRDILTWLETQRTQYSTLSTQHSVGIDPDKEQSLLRKWHETH